MPGDLLPVALAYRKRQLPVAKVSLLLIHAEYYTKNQSLARTAKKAIRASFWRAARIVAGSRVNLVGELINERLMASTASAPAVLSQRLSEGGGRWRSGSRGE